MASGRDAIYRVCTEVSGESFEQMTSDKSQMANHQIGLCNLVFGEKLERNLQLGVAE